jgi:hypothetical protein
MESPSLLAAMGRHSPRAILIGAAVTVCGSLVATTVIGVAAIAGMLIRGESPDYIAAELPGSMALAIFVTLGGLLMSVAGGYTAAALVTKDRYWHAVIASVVATVLTVALLPVWGQSVMDWSTALGIALIVPCGAAGAWLAMPVAPVTACERESG